MDIFQISRERMVREQIIARKISDPNVLEAMKIVPRHLFVEEAFHSQAYRDHPIPIGYGQTISQPYIVAYMSELLEATKGMKVLEIGTGSGYQSAILDTMGLEVYSVERLRELYMKTSTLLMRLRYHSIRLKLADGTEGWEESAPYDRIIVTAGGPTIPTPLIDQLADPGIMIVPVGHEKKGQHLVRVKKNKDIITSETLIPISFVDLVGNYGW